MTSGKVPGFDDVRGEGMSGACAERVRSGASKEIEMLSEASEVGAARRPKNSSLNPACWNSSKHQQSSRAMPAR